MNQFIQQFHFLRPEWLLALLPLMILWVIIHRITQRQSGWQSLLAQHLYQHLIVSKQNGKDKYPLWLIALGWIVASLALAGPSWEKLPQPVYQLNAGKVVLMDMSLSMRATDIRPDRLTRAKFKAIDLIQQAAEGDIGLVAYAGDAFTISPLSTDAQNLITLLPSLSPEIMPVAGSDPYSGLKMAAELLKNAGFVEGDIYWITDGIEMAQVPELKKLLDSLPYRISVLAVGTPEGAPIQLPDGNFLKDRSGAIVIPKLNDGQLKGLASANGGVYSLISADDQDIDKLLDQSLAQHEAKDAEQSEDKFGDEWKEAGPYFILFLIPLAALAFRRGYAFSVLIMFCGMGLSPRLVQAYEWQDLWKTADQQAAQAYANGELDKAAETFQDPMWKGVAKYKKGDYEGALQAFSNLQGTEATYNRANTLAKLGQLDQAIAAYDEVLKSDPQHQDALANKELVEELKQQQQQNQQNDQQGDQNQQNKDQQQQQSDPQNQDENQQQSSNEQQQQSQQQNEQESQQQSDQQQQENSEQSSEKQQESKQQGSEQQDQEKQQDTEQQSQQEQANQVDPEELTEEQKEQIQRMQNLLNKVPDDPAYLLKRKMMLENQLRKRQRMPNTTQRNW